MTMLEREVAMSAITLFLANLKINVGSFGGGEFVDDSEQEATFFPIANYFGLLSDYRYVTRKYSSGIFRIYV